MTRDEFEKARRRFGDDVRSWPAPYRQEGLAFTAAGSLQGGDDDRALERLVLEAASMETDDQALARKVFARIDAGRSGARLQWFWASPAALAASIAAVLAAATAAGYTLGDRSGSLDADLIAFALGAPELAGDAGDLVEAPAGEDAL